MAIGVSAASPELIRNVVLVGPSGGGKTTLVESLLCAAGALARTGHVDAGTTVSDHEGIEREQRRSINLSVASLLVDGVKVNLIDTPGYPEYVGELRAGLRAADASLFVLPGTDGIDEATAMLWDECAAVGMPRAIVVTMLDRDSADFEWVVDQCHDRLGDGDGVVALMLPMLDDDGRVAGFADALTETVHDFSDGSAVTRPIEPGHRDIIDEVRTALLDAIITASQDEDLMDRFLDGDEVDDAMLIRDFERSMSGGHFFPVLATATQPELLGAKAILDLLVRGFPSPTERPVPPATSPDGAPRGPLTCDAAGPLCAEVIKTTSDPFVGRLSLIRIFSGTLTQDAAVNVCGHTGHGRPDHDLREKTGIVSSVLGASLSAIGTGLAGDIVAVSRLVHAETADTISSPDLPLLIEPWIMPDPMFPVGIAPHDRASDDRLSPALARLAAEDPTMRVESDAQQLVMWCMGESHAQVLLHRLRGRYGVDVDIHPLRVALRETIRGRAAGHGRVVKQSGGHGQYAVCDIEIEPLPPGSGVEFVDKAVGGTIPRGYVHAIERGVRDQLDAGITPGSPMVDVRVTLLGGKAHPVDSSDTAFHAAGALAVRDAVTAAGIIALEPVDAVRVTVPNEFVGAVLADLSRRHAHIGATETQGGGRTLIVADVPSSELASYAVDLRAIAHGTAGVTREFARYEPVTRA